MAPDVQLEWEPLVRVGPFRFGQNIVELEQAYKLLLVEEAAGEMQSDQYFFPGRLDVSIYVKEGRVDTISCRQEGRSIHRRHVAGLRIGQDTLRLGWPAI